MTGLFMDWKVGCTILLEACLLALETACLTPNPCGCLVALCSILCDLVLLVLGTVLYNLRNNPV